MSAESVGLGMNLVRHLLRDSFKGYKYCCMHQSLHVYFLTSLYHLQINGNYSLLCFIVVQKDITERFVFSFFPLDSTVNLFGGIVLIAMQEIPRS